MATMQAGLFILMILFACAFTFVGWRAIGKMSAVLHMLAMAFFLGLAIFMSSGYEVSQTSSSTYNDGTTQWNQTSTYTIIPGGTDSYWLWLPFFGLAVMNLALFLREIMTG